MSSPIHQGPDHGIAGSIQAENGGAVQGMGRGDCKETADKIREDLTTGIAEAHTRFK